jgi:flagella basal body P-ring formation protein FlgA
MVVFPLFLAAALAAQPVSRPFTPVDEIDRLVAGFTGYSIGEPGGARAPVDRRLRLAGCATPLQAEWHGTARTTVKVSCPAPGRWHMFVSLLPPHQEAPDRMVVQRGDALVLEIAGRGFTIQQRGVAAQAGAVGDWIEIRTQRAGVSVRGQIVRPGHAVLPQL